VIPPQKKSDMLLFFDGIAIFFVPLYHAIDGYSENPLLFFLPFITHLCLGLFTYTAGYKLFFNHVNDLNRKPFINKYYIKRVIKLYKAYLGYSFLMVIPLLMVTYSAAYILHLNIGGASQFLSTISTMNMQGFFNFLSGENNPVAYQLWYLVALIAITSICFTLLYFLEIKWLFYGFFPFLVISLLFQAGNPVSIPNIVISTFLYLPFFIIGCYWAYQYHYNRDIAIQHTRLFPLLFIILLISSIFLQFFVKADMLIYCSSFFFPFFLAEFSGYIKRISFISSFFIFCGTYSFQIYLFHWPLILPVITRTVIDILHIDYFFMPVLTAVIAVYACVFAYKIVRKIHLNVLFE
jgi:peptidoglycan/LPS O-acetylase OafA/YrhL